MREATAKAIFWAGTLLSAALFLALTWDTHRQIQVLSHADRLTEPVVAGKHAFEKYNCNDCHTILGFGAYYAPDLTRAYTRLGEAALTRRLQHPEVAFADSWRKMPQQNLAPQEVQDLVAYLRWVSEIENNDWPPQHSEQRWRRSTARLIATGVLSPGAALVQQEGCLTCHALGKEGERMGQRLEWIGRSRDAGWIAAYLEDPERFAPGAEMPAFAHLTAADRRAIGEFLVAVGRNAGGEP